MAEEDRIPNPGLPSDGHSIRVIANGTSVAIFRVAGELYAIDPRCTHIGGPLDQGPLSGTEVTCPWHHSVFDVRDGKVLRGPATKPVAHYRVRLDGDSIILVRE